MDRAETVERELDFVELIREPAGDRPSEPPAAMDTDLERLLIAIHEPAHL